MLLLDPVFDLKHGNIRETAPDSQLWEVTLDIDRIESKVFLHMKLMRLLFERYSIMMTMLSRGVKVGFSERESALW